MNNKALCNAAKEGNSKKVEELIKAGTNINSYYQGYTPLQYCLIQHDRKKSQEIESHYKECAIKLLENGAKPEADYKLEDFELQRVIQVYAWAENSSLVRLLTIYGESNDSIKFRTQSSPAKNVFLTTKKLFEEKSNLESSLINLSYGDTAKAKIYKRLEEIWQKVADVETDIIFKNHYQKKANVYKEWANSPKEVMQRSAIQNRDTNKLKHRNTSSEETQSLMGNVIS